MSSGCIKIALLPKPQSGLKPASDDGGVTSVGAFGETAPESTISFNKGSKPLIHHPAIL